MILYGSAIKTLLLTNVMHNQYNGEANRYADICDTSQKRRWHLYCEAVLPHTFSRLVLFGTMATVILALLGVDLAPSAHAYAVTEPGDNDPVMREISRRRKVESRINGNTRAYATVPMAHEIPPTVPVRGQNFDFLPIHSSRLICRVQDRFNDSDSSDVFREQLISRLSSQLTVTPSNVLGVLIDPYYCDSIQPGEEQYMFYDGGEYNKSPSKLMWEDTFSTLTVINFVPIDTPAVTPAPAPTKTEAVVDKGDESLDFSPEPTAEVTEDIEPDTKVKLSMLCRAQERGMKNAYFNENVDDIASLFAARWNMDSEIIADALRNPELCSNPTASMLVMKTDTPYEAADEPVNESTPKALLVMVGGIAFAFVIIILVLVFNLVQSTNKIVEKK